MLAHIYKTSKRTHTHTHANVYSELERGKPFLLQPYNILYYISVYAEHDNYQKTWGKKSENMAIKTAVFSHPCFKRILNKILRDMRMCATDRYVNTLKTVKHLIFFHF